MRFISIVFLFVCSFTLTAYAARTASDTGPEIGRYAPPIELNDLSGKPETLESMRGSVVLLNFWSTLCSPSTAEMPSLNRLYSALHDKGLQVVSVAIDQADTTVREYVAKNDIAFPVLLDNEKGVFSGKYAAPVLPVTYLIDRSGLIVEKFSGLAVWDAPEMKNRVLLELEKK